MPPHSTAVDSIVRVMVLAAYSDTDPASCNCCHQETPEFLNPVLQRLDENGMQIFRGNEVIPASRWETLQRVGLPPGYVIYCSNCIVAHRMGDCPYQHATPGVT